MKSQQSLSSLLTTACAAEAVCCIFQNVVGDDVAGTFNNAPLTRGVVHNLAITELKNAVAAKTGVN